MPGKGGMPAAGVGSGSGGGRCSGGGVGSGSRGGRGSGGGMPVAAVEAAKAPLGVGSSTGGGCSGSGGSGGGGGCSGTGGGGGGGGWQRRHRLRSNPNQFGPEFVASVATPNLGPTIFAGLSNFGCVFFENQRGCKLILVTQN